MVLAIFFEIETAVGVYWQSRGRDQRAYSPLGDNDGNITPDIEVPIGVGGRYLDTGVPETVFERFAKHRMIRSVVCCKK